MCAVELVPADYCATNVNIEFRNYYIPRIFPVRLRSRSKHAWKALCPVKTSNAKCVSLKRLQGKASFSLTWAPSKLSCNAKELCIIGMLILSRTLYFSIRSKRTVWVNEMVSVRNLCRTQYSRRVSLPWQPAAHKGDDTLISPLPGDGTWKPIGAAWNLQRDNTRKGRSYIVEVFLIRSTWQADVMKNNAIDVFIKQA